MKKTLSRIAVAALALCFTFGIAACSEDVTDLSADPSSSGNTSAEDDANYSNDFTEQVDSWEKVTNSKFGVTYWTATAVYCENPTHPGVQSVCVYSPEAYLNSDGTVNTTATVGGYTAETAPIIYWNSHGSYIGMGPFKINGTSTRATQNGWVLNMINEGFVVCMVGERGKTTADDSGNVIGRGPIAISDLKAGVRFLKHNDSVIPGSSDRIVSVGTSSGGAMSALLGTSGNCSYYDTYLQEMGACMDETDDVYATMAYCPITDLSHADFAYEWMFGEDTETVEMSEFELALSSKFKVEYASYINGLELTDEDGNALTLATDGSKSGTYYDWLVSKYEDAFEDYAENYEADYKDYATGTTAGGASEADDWDWLEYNASTGEAKLVTPEGYDSALDALVLSGYNSRQKSCPSFDELDPYGGDNDVFGEQNTPAGESARHFNQTIAEMIGELKDQFPDEYEEYYQLYYDESHNEEVIEWSKYLNSYSFLTGEAESDISPYFRVNMGAQDSDTSITVSATLALLLEKNDINTEFNVMWAWGHNDVDTPSGLTDWVKSITK